MNHLERVSYILGTLLIGIAGWIVLSDRRSRAAHPPVDKLAGALKQAWAAYHTP